MTFDLGGRKIEDLPLSYTVDVDAWSGTATMRVVVPISSGRDARGPALSLVYSSGAGTSEFGVGWSLAGIPAIGIDTREAAPRWDGQDGYEIAGSQLVPWLEETSSGWRPRTRTAGPYAVAFYRSKLGGAHIRVERWTEIATGRVHFRSRDARNVVTIYGARPAAAARIADPDDEARTFTWLPELQLDPHGTAMWLDYASETLDGVDRSAPYEPRQPSLAKRYLKRIRYSNTKPLQLDDAVLAGQLPSDVRWCFATVLDYGDHSEELAGIAADRPWSARLDPTTNTRAGFPVRTYRLCRRILMFHAFDELAPVPALVGAMRLHHHEGVRGSTVERLDYTGYRRNGDEVASSTVPALVMSYAPSAIESGFHGVPLATRENLPSGLASRRTSFVDLFGEGLPGMLTETERAWHYKQNLGGGVYAAETIVLERPAVRAGTGTMGDLDADGDTDLAQLGGRFAGRFVLDREKRQWEPFAPFIAFPHVEALGTRARWVDLNGDGQLDVVIPKQDSLVWFASRGSDFDAPVEVPLPPGFEPTLDTDPARDLFFADMNGDGMPDLVRVRSGSVEYWPSLGHGRFGERIVMEDVPQLARAGDFDASRVRFVDLDGSGTADIVYLDHGEVSCWINAAGNRLIEGTRLTGLPYLDNASNVQIIDFLGEGRPCLVWSTPLPGRASPIEYLPLAPSIRPRLLVAVDDSRGCEWRLTYSTSASHYLRDRDAGRPWQTRLPAHYSVVDRRETIDQIGNTRSVRRYAYHDGFYDGAKRERRGFGHVDIFDEDMLQTAAEPDPPSVSAGSLTTLWFHRGTPMWDVDGAMYTADRELAVLPPHTITDDVGLTWAQTEDGLRALAGLVIRRETWSYDPRTAIRQEHPIEVEQTSYQVRCVQPALDGDRSAAFSSLKCENLTTTYEERPADPRVRHIVVEADRFELPARDFDIGYARRESAPREIAAQGRHHVLVHQHGLLSIDEDERFELGIQIEVKTYELVGVRPDSNGLFSRAQLLEPTIPAALATAASHDAVLADDPTGGPQARLLAWDRGVYWNDDLTAALATGSAGHVTLIHHEETACFSPQFVDDIFGTRVDDARLLDLGYRFADGLWWARGDIHTFAPPDRFFQRAAIERADGARVAYEYDASSVEIVAITDPLGHRTTATLDYWTMMPSSCTDANGTISEVRFDPLGVAVASSQHGHVGPHRWGFEPIAALAAMTATTLDEVLEDPAALVQQAARVTWYDLHAWQRDRVPPTLAILQREVHVHDGAGGISPQGHVHVSVAHLDGLRRVLQKKTIAASGPAIQRDAAGNVVVDAAGFPVLAHADRRWRSTGHVVFDAKQRPSRAFDPFFTTTHRYEGDDVLDQLGVATTNHYDTSGRLIRQDLPDGTFTRVTYGPWSIDREDPNDTVLDSTYRALREGLPASDGRKQALEHAKTHANTPNTRYLDPFGRDSGSLSRGGATGSDRRSEISLAIEGPIRSITDPRGLAAFAYRHDMRGRRLYEHSVDAGDRSSLVDASGRIRWVWTPRDFVVERGYDIADRPTFTHVRGGDGSTALDHRVEEWHYAEELAPSVAAASNLTGRAIRVRDAAGEGTIDIYAPDGRVVSASRRMRMEIDNTPDWRTSVEIDAEVFTTTARYDAMGRVTVESLPDGSTREHAYSPDGSKISTRITTSDGKLTNVPVLSDVTSDARGQCEQITLGNGTIISYSYDRQTSRLHKQTAQLGARTLQDLEYSFDPAGNLVRMVDAAQEGPTAIFGGVSARRDYTYDAHHRVLTATGRIHQALLEHDYMPGAGRAKGTRHLSLNNAAAVERYTQVFSYDVSGNLTSVRHAGTTQSWTTAMWISDTSNRSLRAVDANGIALTNPEGAFDAAGNVRHLDHLRRMDWSWRGNLERALLVERNDGTDDEEAYVYSVDGVRVRRVSTRVVTGDIVEVEEKIYFGGCERKRVRRGSNVRLERWTSMIDDGTRRIAVIHRWTTDTTSRETDDVSRAHVRYQLATHQGSSAIELDQAGDLISYEEYLPFGGTAFLAGSNMRDVDLKEYRYSGKECDDATNLYNYGHRYYAPWLGRWLSPDPAGITDSYNLYQFVLSNPITFVDPNGLQATGQTVEAEHVTYAVNTTSQIPAWARPVWDALDEYQRSEIKSGEKAIVRTTEGVLIVSAAENERLIAENAGRDQELYLIGASAQEGDEDGGGGVDEPYVSDDQFVGGISVDFSEEGETIVAGGSDGVLPVKATDGTALKGGVTAGPSGKTANASTGSGSKPKPAKKADAEGGGTGDRGSGTGSGARGGGTGGGGAVVSTGAGMAVVGGGAGGLPGQATSGAVGGGTGQATGQKSAGTKQGEVASATTTGSATGSATGVEGGLEGGVEGGTGTHAVETNTRNVGGTGTSGTGTQTGGSTDPKLKPTTDANPNANVKEQGTDANGSEKGSATAKEGGREGGRPGGSKKGTAQGTHTDGTADGRAEGLSDGTPNGKRTTEYDALDIATRVAGLANFEFSLPNPNGKPRGVPGGRGSTNLGWFGQVLYIGLTVLSWLGPGAIVKAFAGGAKLASKGASLLTKMLTGAEAKIVTEMEEKAVQRVLVVGEAHTFEYSANLARENPGMQVTASSYGQGVKPEFPDIPNLQVHPGSVDATNLAEHFGGNSFDDIVFNGPRSAEKGAWKAEAGNLVDDTLGSAKDVLTPKGSVHFSASEGMPAAPRLNSHAKGGTDMFPVPEGWNPPAKVPYSSTPFGVPYQPMSNAGKPLPTTTDMMSWFIFGQKSGK